MLNEESTLEDLMHVGSVHAYEHLLSICKSINFMGDKHPPFWAPKVMEEALYGLGSEDGCRYEMNPYRAFLCAKDAWMKLIMERDCALDLSYYVSRWSKDWSSNTFDDMSDIEGIRCLHWEETDLVSITGGKSRIYADATLLDGRIYKFFAFMEPEGNGLVDEPEERQLSLF